MKISKKILLSFVLLLTALTLIGCRDRQASNDDITVIFYTGLDSTNVVSSTIAPIIDIEPGDLVVRPEDPTAPGALFLGWYKEKECINEWNFETDVVIGSTVIYSKWVLGDLTITYIFDEAGGTFLDEPATSYTISETIILPKADRLGSLFLGWILTPISQYKVGDTLIKTTAGFSTPLVLYALFENKEYTIRFRSLLTEVANPGTHVIEYASILDFPVLSDTATKTFVGWFSTDGTLTGEWGFQYVNGEIYLGKAMSFNAETNEWVFLPQGITVYAKWANK